MTDNFDDGFGDVEALSTGGSFFTPKEHADAALILFEPTRFAENQEGYKGKITDRVWGNYFVFKTPASLEAGEPSVTLVNVHCDSAGVVDRGRKVLDSKSMKVLPFRLEKTVTKGGNQFWDLKSPAPELTEGAKKFWRKHGEDATAAADRMAALMG